jgi:hypothetical protein
MNIKRRADDSINKRICYVCGETIPEGKGCYDAGLWILTCHPGCTHTVRLTRKDYSRSSRGRHRPRGQTLRLLAEPQTVQQELDRRDDCRYGLAGVLVEYQGQTWRVASCEWNADGNLVIDLLPPDHAEFSEEPRFMSCAELAAYRFPECGRQDVPAPECVLVSKWPHVCGCYLDARRSG